MGSTGGRNTLIFCQGWSVRHEVPPPYLLFCRVPRRDLGSAAVAVCNADQGCQQRFQERNLGADQTIQAAAKGALQIPDLGPRQGTGGSSAPDTGNRCRRLLLRPTFTMATWIERKYQPSPAPVLSERPGYVDLQPGQTQRCRAPSQRAAEKDRAIPNTGREVRRVCCSDQLNPQPTSAIAKLQAGIFFAFRTWHLKQQSPWVSRYR